ncbi:hypothetical protein [Armatimonas sp.]|uniref:hypothetical protein n=1 Tax=Armatimonas sp. TaxID=1872638 RepID=UPI0037518E79
MSTDKRFSRSERALVAVGILVPSLVLAGVAINARLNDVPPLVLPQHTLPVPNAHDTLRVAKVQVVPLKDGIELSPKDIKKVQPLAGRKALLAANTEAIAKIQQALSQEYRQPITYETSQLFPEYAEHRELARLLAFAAKTHADSGNYSEAARCATDAMALGMKIPRGGALIGALVGMACEAIGRNALLGVVGNLDATTLEATLERLDTLEKERWLLAETLEVEHLWSQKAIRDMAKQGPLETAKMLGMGTESGSERWLALRLMFTPKRLAAENNDRHYAKLIAVVKQPYRKGGVSLPAPTDVINEILSPVFDQAYFVDTKNRTEANLLRARLSLLRTGKVAPRFTDPFGQDKPLRVKTDGEHFILYSVGPDGDDDNGRAGVPSQSFMAKLERGRTLSAQDEGDLVMGVNTY